MENENTGIVPPTAIASQAGVVVPAPSPAALHFTPEHISALHRHLDQIGAAVKDGFEKVLAFVKKEAPVIAAGAAAVATAVPGTGAVAGVVEKVVGVVESAVNCICSCSAYHGPKGCSAPGCSCKAPNTLSRAAS
jgi:hypothetical protein